jgi:hypothetical protein
MSTPAIVWTSTAASPRNNYTGTIGYEFQVGANDIVVTDLGRLRLAGNANSHTVWLTDNKATRMASVSVDMSTGSAEAFNYAAITPLRLAAGQKYRIFSGEVDSDGDNWYDAGPHTKTVDSAIAGITVAAYGDADALSQNIGTTPDNSYGIPSFKFDVATTPANQVLHVLAYSVDGGNTAAVTFDSTGCDAIMIHLVRGASGFSWNDSKGNTPIQLTEQNQGGVRSCWFYIQAPTVGSGHTLEVTSTAGFPSFEVVGFSGMETVAALVSAEDGNTAGSGTTIQPAGAVTPIAAGDIALTGLWWAAAAGNDAPTIDESFERWSFVRQNPSPGNCYGSAIAVRTGTTSALQPTWTKDSASAAVTIAVFRAAAAGPVIDAVTPDTFADAETGIVIAGSNF